MPVREGRSCGNKQPHASGLSAKSASLSAPSRWEGRGPTLILGPQAPPLRTSEPRLAGEGWRDHEGGWGQGLRSQGAWRHWGPRHGIGKHRQEAGEGRVSRGSGHGCQLQKPKQRRPGGVVWVWAQWGDARRETVGSEQAGGRPRVSSCTVTLITCSAFTHASVRNAGRAFLWEEPWGLVVQPPPTATCSRIRGAGAWGPGLETERAGSLPGQVGARGWQTGDRRHRRQGDRSGCLCTHVSPDGGWGSGRGVRLGPWAPGWVSLQGGQLQWAWNCQEAKECSNYHPVALLSHASKVMLRIFQARL